VRGQGRHHMYELGTPSPTKRPGTASEGGGGGAGRNHWGARGVIMEGAWHAHYFAGRDTLNVCSGAPSLIAWEASSVCGHWPGAFHSVVRGAVIGCSGMS
jgi:hypothetical protein